MSEIALDERDATIATMIKAATNKILGSFVMTFLCPDQKWFYVSNDLELKMNPFLYL